MSSMKNLLPALLILGLVGTIAYAVTTSLTIPNNGDIEVSVELAAFADQALTTPFTAFAWGTIHPGDQVTKLLWLNSTSNVPITLNMTASGWSPTASEDLLALTWNREGTTIDPDDPAIDATFTLTVLPTTANVTFAFTTHINATPIEE